MGCILKAPVPTRESPLYEEIEDVYSDLPVQITRNVWQVSGTTVGLYMRSGPGTRYKNYGYLRDGAKVNEIGRRTVDGRVWLNVIVQKGGRKCWMSTKYLRQVGTVTETIKQGVIVGQRSIVYEQSRDQFFRIYSVERDAKARTVSVKATHVFYDLCGDLVNGAYEVEKKTAADAVLRNIFGKLTADMGFELHIAAGVDKKIKGDFGWKNPVECMLDPDDGVLSLAGALLVRDNYDIYVLPDVIRDSGVTIRRGKNLKGVTVTEDAAGVVTRIIPCGKSKKGDDLFLSGTRWIDSPRINDYPTPHTKKIDYDVKVVDKDADNETTFSNATAARSRLRELAEADFAENGLDLPSYGMDVDFVLLQNTEEYQNYASLQAVYLNDTVTVIDSLIGLTAKLRVTGYTWDAMREQYESVTLGDISSLSQTVYSYNLPTGGVSGTKLAPGSTPGTVLRNATIEYAKITAAAIEQLTADSIAAMTAKIQEIVSHSLTTDELYAALAALNKAVIEHADIQWADIETLKAAVAALAQANIGTADIGWAQIKDLITGAAIFTEGVGGKLMISRLAVTEANMVSLTTGELIVKGADGCFYSVTVDAEGNIQTELKQIDNGDVTDFSIDAGEKLIEGSVTAACLNATDIFANNATIQRLIAAHLDVDALFAREAFLALLRTSKIIGDKSLTILTQELEETRSTLSRWFTFDNEQGFVVQKPAYVDEHGTEHAASIWRTVMDEIGYHIYRADLAEPVGSFFRDRQKTHGVQIGDMLVKATGTGGWVWTDAE